MSKNSQSIRFRIAFPVILLGFIFAIAGTYLIEQLLEGHITKEFRKELHNFGNRLYYVTKSNYTTLFYNYGTDVLSFTDMEPLVMDETIDMLERMLEESKGYEAYILTPYDVIPITGALLTREEVEVALKQGFLKTDSCVKMLHQKSFLPWSWTIVTLRKTSELKSIVITNRYLLLLIIAGLVVLIILVLYYVLSRTIAKPFRTIFDYLKGIQQGIYTPLSISSSKEIESLVKHLNTMTSMIAKREREISDQYRYMREILDTGASIVLVTNGKQIVEANSRFFEFFHEYKDIDAFKEEHQCVCDFFEVLDDPEYVYADEKVLWIDRILEDTETIYKALIIRQGIERHFAVYANALQLGGEKRVVITMAEITEMIEQRKDQERQLYTDDLTQLPNRLKLMRDVKKTNRAMTLVLINIDGFKMVNDLYGTDSGDLLLKAFGALLMKVKDGEYFTIYRMQGDEFAALGLTVLGDRALKEKIEACSKQLEEHMFDLKGTQHSIHVTMGAAVGKKNLLTEADMALKGAKHDKTPYRIYRAEHGMSERFEKRMMWTNELKSALMQDRIVPFFQPIVCGVSGNIVKYETLMRLMDQDGRAIAPGEFLGIAKEVRLYPALTKTILEKSLTRLEQLPCSISINISYLDIANHDVMKVLEHFYHHYGTLERVTFEILESESLANIESVQNFITRVKEMGCRIAIDDFGSGYSNFETILKLDIDYLKIDGSLIRVLGTDRNATIMVETITSFARQMGVKTIAEFVSNETIAEHVQKTGIDYLQGYFYGKPIPNPEK